MKVFCPNCGTQNEGMPGGRLTCSGCTASFEVPREGGVVSPQPQVFSPTVAPPPASFPFPTGLVGPPASGFEAEREGAQAGGQQNALAIISLVLGLLCCVPFASIAAIVTGVIAQNQINASGGQQRGRELAMAGIILGSLSVLLAIAFGALNLVGHR